MKSQSAAAHSLQVKLTYKKHGMFSCKLQPLRLLDLMVFLKQKRDRGFLGAVGWSCRLLWLSKIEENRQSRTRSNLLHNLLNLFEFDIPLLKNCNEYMSYTDFILREAVLNESENERNICLNAKWEDSSWILLKTQVQNLDSPGQFYSPPAFSQGRSSYSTSRAHWASCRA